MSKHLCHAQDCTRPVPPKMFMCRTHWFMVPKPMQDRIWRHYVPGQERRKDPTLEYLAAAMEAIRYVAELEAAKS
jgi:hypothetical protein